MRRPSSTASDAEEVQIRRLVNELTTRVDWRWAQTRPPSIALGWKPESGFLPYDWRGYNEAAVVYLLAMGHPTRPLDGSAWTAWTKEFRANWSTFHGQQGLSFPPLFGHQYSNVWVDFRDLRDAFSRRHNIDYAENSRRAAHAQRAYAMLNPKGWRGYDADVWGFTACDGPADMIAPYRGEPRRFYSYVARGAGGGKVASVDDGTIAPTAAASSIAFAPDIAIPAIITMVRRYGTHIYGQYGFVDAFNPSFQFETPHLIVRQGRARLRLGGHRLPRHRPGADPGDDRQLHQRLGVADDDQVHAVASRPAARRLHRRLARGRLVGHRMSREARRSD